MTIVNVSENFEINLFLIYISFAQNHNQSQFSQNITLAINPKNILDSSKYQWFLDN